MKSVLTLLFIAVFSMPLLAQENTATIEDSTFIYRSIDEGLKNPEKVFRLNLSKNKLDSFPSQIFKFTNLEELDLTRNRIEELPAQIGTLIHLKKLKMGNNKLVHLPNEIGQLKELVELDLNRNELEDLPKTIGGLESLEILSLWDNELGDVPDEIGDLKNLKLLELRGILFTEEQQQRIDDLVVKSAKIYLSPSCNCKN